MLDLHFEIQLPDLTLKADCTLPGQGFTDILGLQAAARRRSQVVLRA